jgi:hypothetical protein
MMSGDDNNVTMRTLMCGQIAHTHLLALPAFAADEASKLPTDDFADLPIAFSRPTPSWLSVPPRCRFVAVPAAAAAPAAAAVPAADVVPAATALRPSAALAETAAGPFAP